MAAPTASLFDTHSKQIEEVINKKIDLILPTLDPCWRETIVSNQGVMDAGSLGRDLVAIKIYRGALTGVIEQGWPRGDTTLYGDQTTPFGTTLYTQQLTRTWPDATEGPKAAPFRLKIHLRSMLTNFMTTLGELQAEATPAFIGDVIAPALKSFAHNIAHTLCNYWYVSQNTAYSLDTITGTVSYSNSYKTATFQLTNKCFDRFQRGQRIDIYSATNFGTSSSTRINELNGTRVKVFVTAVDPLLGTVSVTSDQILDASHGGQLTALASGQYLTYANSFRSTAFGSGGGSSQGAFFTGIAGINSWLKAGGTASGASDDTLLLGAEADATDRIDVNLYPEFKSAYWGSVGTLTEHGLRQYLARFGAAKRPLGQSIDTLIASDGVWMNYIGQKTGREYLDRTGRVATLANEGGDGEGFSFSFEGRTYKGYTSSYVEKNTLYGIKKGNNNWKRLVPPDPKGVTKFDQAPAFAPFSFVMGALTGTGSPKWPILTNNGASITEGVQMPGMMRMQLVPDQPAGLKLGGVTEDRVQTDT